MTETLTRLPVDRIITDWRPGSHDWTWDEEYRDLTVDNPVTDAIRRRVDTEGIGFQDDIAPVMLGSDGRVWDGHHRICIAIERDITHLDVEIVTEGEQHG